ncbi:MAG: hypothetical protein JXA50_05305 [Deltaproteobacteria bacterium]|nr:hypothetical protein [Deltaproteobacteria bacterium]
MPLHYSQSMKIISILAIVIVVFAFGCNNQEQTRGDSPLPAGGSKKWKNGQAVEITGLIYPSKANARFYIETKDGKVAHIKSGTDIDILEVETALWVRGTIEYVQHERPQDYDEKQYGVKFPQTICYISVEDFKILDKL